MKLKKYSVEILERINKILADFALNNGNLCFNQITKNDNKEYVGSMKFDFFTAYFFFGEEYPMGYSFMETPMSANYDSVSLNRNITFLTRFKFDFSKILFSPYDIHNAINLHDFQTLDFHEIKTFEDAESDLAIILGFIQKSLVLINNINTDVNLQNKLLDNYFSDCNALIRKFDKEEFYADIEEDVAISLDSCEVLKYLHIDLQEGVERFLSTGSYSALVKKANKLEKKGKITVFEKRYTDYLAENGYPAPNDNVTQRTLKNKRSRNWNLGVTVISFILAIITAVPTDILIEEKAVNRFFEQKIYIATLADDFTYFLLTVCLLVLFRGIILSIPAIHKKIYSNQYLSNGKKWIRRVAIIIAFVLAIASPFISMSHVKNNSFVFENNQIYFSNEPVDKSDVEIVYIQGYYTVDDNGNEVLVTGGDAVSYYIVLKDRDAVFCEGLITDNGYEKTETVQSLKQAGYTFTTYDCYEDFLDSY